MVPEHDLKPDPEAIRRDLEAMTARWGELSEKAVFEIRALAEGKKPTSMRFSPDWMDDAVEAVINMNNLGRNLYVVRNPIRHDVSGSAGDEDILASFYLWADCDDDEASSNVLRFNGPKHSKAVVTGETPGVRVHIYWDLEKPCTDMDAWRDMQSRIAHHLKSDKAVINPSRIMRIGGTVTYPDAKKRAAGYISELTTIRTEYPEHRPPVTLDQMARVFGAAPADGNLLGRAAGAAFNIDTGPVPLDRERERIQAMSGDEWHNSVIRLVGSYVAKGLSDGEIHGLTDPLTLPGYTVDQTRREVQTAIDGARAKGWTPSPPDQFTQPAPATEEAEWPSPVAMWDEEALPRRRWVYGTSYIKGYLSVLAAPGGVGKTSLGLVEGFAIATGKPLLKEAVKERTNVWLLNLEDPLQEMLLRFHAAKKWYGLTRDDLEDRFFMDGEDTLSLTLAMEGSNGISFNTDLLEKMVERVAEKNIGTIILDPFVSTHMVNENSNASIQAVAAMLRDLARRTDAAVMLVHHTRKGNGENATIDSVRGAGALVGAARSARVVNKVSPEEAEKFGVSPDMSKGIFRVDDGKANMAPPAEDASYRKMVGVELANGEWVGVATPFNLPDEWSGMTEEVINDILRLIDKGPLRDDGTEEYFSERPQDKSRWVGNVITDYPFPKTEDFKTEGQAKMIIKTWMKNGLIKPVEYWSEAQRKDRKGVVSNGRVGDQN